MRDELQAVLDLGTNTFHLLIAGLTNDGVQEYKQVQIPVKIGTGGINKGFITPEAYARGMQALDNFYQIIQTFPVNKIIACGTSAIRNASNGADFLREAKTRFGFDIQSISGDQEAEFIYRGVSLSFPFPDEPVLVMDIGGGSVELIIGIREKILWKHSFEIGAARLLDQFKPSNPIMEEEISAIENYLSRQLEPLKSALWEIETSHGKPQVLIGSAGSYETLLDVLELDLSRKKTSLSPFAHEVHREDAELFFNYILGSNQSQRETMKGLLDFRVDMIVVATLLMRYIYSGFGLNRLVASNYALKEGLLLR